MKQKSKEDLEEVATELELTDDDERVPYATVSHTIYAYVLMSASQATR